MQAKPKVVVPAFIVRAIGAMRLSRELTVRINATLHDQIGGISADSPKLRIVDDDRHFLARIVLNEGNIAHTFPLVVDDATANGHWIVVAIRHHADHRN